MKKMILQNEVVAILKSDCFLQNNTDFASSNNVFFSGNVDDGTRSVLIVADGETANVVYCERTAKFYKKRLSSDGGLKL